MVTTPHCQPRVVLERAGEGEMKLSMRGPNVLTLSNILRCEAKTMLKVVKIKISSSKVESGLTYPYWALLSLT